MKSIRLRIHIGGRIAKKRSARKKKIIEFPLLEEEEKGERLGKIHRRKEVGRTGARRLLVAFQKVEEKKGSS